MKAVTYKQCVSLPADLKKRMDKVADRVNWSAVASRAFEQKLSQIGIEKPIEQRLIDLQKELDEVKAMVCKSNNG